MKKLFLLLYFCLFVFSCGIDESDEDVLVLYNVIYVGNRADSGSVEPHRNVVRNARISVRDNGFTRTGYRFTKWNTQRNGTGDSYYPGDALSLKVTKSLFLYAQWERAYTVTFNAGTGGTGSMEPQQAVRGERLSKCTFTNAGKSFKGWSESDTGAVECGDEGLFLKNSDVALYAQWSTSSEKVLTYDPNGGNGGTNVVPQTSSNSSGSSSVDVSANTYTRTDYIFDCWNTQPNGMGTDYRSGSFSLSNNTTLYAKWIRLGVSPAYICIQPPDQGKMARSYGGEPTDLAKAVRDMFPKTAPYTDPDFWAVRPVGKKGTNGVITHDEMCYPLNKIITREMVYAAMRGERSTIEGCSIVNTGGFIANDTPIGSFDVRKLYSATVKSNGDGASPESIQISSGSYCILMEWELWDHCYITDLTNSRRARWLAEYVAGEGRNIPGIGGQFRSITGIGDVLLARRIDVYNPSLTNDSEYPVRTKGYENRIAYYPEASEGNLMRFSLSETSHWYDTGFYAMKRIKADSEDPVKISLRNQLVPVDAVPASEFLSSYVLREEDGSWTGIEVTGLDDRGNEKKQTYSKTIIMDDDKDDKCSVYFLPGYEKFCNIIANEMHDIVNYPYLIEIKGAEAYDNSNPPQAPPCPPKMW